MGDDDHGFHHETQKFVVFMIFAMLLTGAAIRHLLTRFTKIPYTVVLICVGYAFKYIMGTDSALIKYEEIANIDPHLLLLCFLPILLFESTFSIEYHIFRKSIYSILWLAVPGVLLATGLTSLFVHYIIPYNWSWTLSLLFGSIVSATDPVAVVALLRELGAAKTLATLIEGESLLNDGTAIVIFSQVLRAYREERDTDKAHFDPLNSIVNLLWVSISAPLFGSFCSWLAIKWLGVVYNDKYVEVTIVLASVYLVYYIAEMFLHASGVLAVVAFGLVLNNIGRSRISPNVQHFIHEFYAMMEYLANTMIFLLVGFIAAEHTAIHINDYGYLIILYIGLHIVRGTVIIILLPLLRRTGYGLNWKESVILAASGLRGSVALALGLVSAIEIIDDKTSNQMLFYIAGIVILTLGINGTFIRTLLHMLNMSSMDPIKEQSLARASLLIREKTTQKWESLLRDPYIAEANWTKVREYQFDPSKYLNFNEEQSTIHSISLRNSALRIAQLDGKHRMLTFMIRHFWHQFETGYLGHSAVLVLTDIVEEIRDSSKVESWPGIHELEKYIQIPAWIQESQRFSRIPLIGSVFRGYLFDHLLLSFHVAFGYLRAVEDVIHAADKNSVHFFCNSTTAEMLINIAETNKRPVLQAIATIKDMYPEIAAAVKTVHASNQLLNYQQQIVKHMRESGILEEDEMNHMNIGIQACMKRVLFAPPELKIGSITSLLVELPCFRSLQPATLRSLSRFCDESFYKQGSKILDLNVSRPKAIFLIVRGFIRMEGDEAFTQEGRGFMFNDENFVVSQSEIRYVVYAETDTRILRIPYSSLRVLIERHSNVLDAIWKSVSMRIAVNYLCSIKPFSQLPRSSLQTWVQSASISIYHDKDLVRRKKYSLDHVGMLIHGELKVHRLNSVHTRKIGALHCPILLHGPCTYRPQGTSVILVFKDYYNIKRTSAMNMFDFDKVGIETPAASPSAYDSTTENDNSTLSLFMTKPVRRKSFRRSYSDHFDDDEKNNDESSKQLSNGTKRTQTLQIVVSSASNTNYIKSSSSPPTPIELSDTDDNSPIDLLPGTIN